MKFTVLWMPVAEQRLAHLWITAVDRNAVARAADTVCALSFVALQGNPEAVSDMRHAAYVRRQRAKHGPKVRVTRRRKKGSRAA